MTDRSLPPKAPDIHALLEPLVRHGVDFVLIGGMAGIAHGSNYPSFDLDIAYARNRANIDRLVAALEEIGVRLRIGAPAATDVSTGEPEDLPFLLDRKTIEKGANFTFVTPHGDLDVLGDVAGIRNFDELNTDAEAKEIAGLPIKVASIDHLIAMKRAANRTKDKLMLEEYIVIADEQRRAGES